MLKVILELQTQHLIGVEVDFDFKLDFKVSWTQGLLMNLAPEELEFCKFDLAN